MEENVNKNENEQQVIKKITTTEEIIKPAAQTEPEKKLPEVVQVDFTGISIKTETLSDEAKKIMSDICEFDRISEIVANELPEITEDDYPEKSALINALTEGLNLETLKKAENLSSREQLVVLSCFFKMCKTFFGAIQTSKQSNAGDWFKIIMKDMAGLFNSAERDKISVVQSKEVLANSMSAWLALAKVYQNRKRKISKEDSRKLEVTIKEAIKEIKTSQSKEFQKKVFNGMKRIYSREKSQDIQTFAVNEILPEVKKANKLYQQCDTLFHQLQSQMRNSIHKFMLPAMKTCLLAAPVQRIIEVCTSLDTIIRSDMKYGAGDFSIQGINNHFIEFQSAWNRAQMLIDMGKREVQDLEQTMIILDNMGSKISALRAKDDLSLSKLENSLKIGQIAGVVKILINNTLLNKAMLTNYMTWWKELEVFSFENTSQKLLGIFQ